MDIGVSLVDENTTPTALPATLSRLEGTLDFGRQSSNFGKDDLLGFLDIGHARFDGEHADLEPILTRSQPIQAVLDFDVSDLELGECFAYQSDSLVESFRYRIHVSPRTLALAENQLTHFVEALVDLREAFVDPPVDSAEAISDFVSVHADP
jgi:hypothetical protein